MAPPRPAPAAGDWLDRRLLAELDRLMPEVPALMRPLVRARAAAELPRLRALVVQLADELAERKVTTHE